MRKRPAATAAIREYLSKVGRLGKGQSSDRKRESSRANLKLARAARNADGSERGVSGEPGQPGIEPGER